MPITTYSELKLSILNWSKRTGDDVMSVLDDFIDLAEADIWQRLRIRDMETEATLSSSTSVRTVALPSAFLQARRLCIDRTDLDDVVLQYETPMSLRVIESAGMPLRFTVTNQIELDRVSDQVYTLKLQYYASLTALSNSNTTNAVLTRFPMVYLYASLFHYAQWAQDDTLIERYALLAEGAINAANAADRKGRYGPAPGIRMMSATP